MTQVNNSQAPFSSPPGNRRRSQRVRIMLIVAPIILVIFAALAVTSGLQQRQFAQQQISGAHNTLVGDVSEDLNTIIDTWADATRRLANIRSAREFARDTLISVSGTALDQSQQRMLADFLTLIQQNPQDFAAVRYVTYTGSVWTEVTNYNVGIPVPNNAVRLGEQENDALLREALGGALGSVVLNEIDFYRDPTAFAQDRLVPFIRLTSPVAVEGNVSNIAGVIQIDAFVTPLLTELDTALDVLEMQNTRRLLLVDALGRVWADSANANLSFVNDIAANTPTLLSAENAAANTLINETVRTERFAQSGQIINSAVERDGYVISTADIALAETPGAYLRLVLIDDFDALQAEGIVQASTIGIGLMSVAVALCALLWFVLGRVLAPLQGVSTMADAMVKRVLSAGGSSTDTAVPSTYTSQVIELPRELAALPPEDDMRRLFESFQLMSQRLETMQKDIETRVGRYSRNLDIAARIGRETATLYDADQLLNRAINLICEEFGFYHAQVFLLDDVGRNAVLVYSYGERGQRLLEQKHKLAVGSNSVIGRVTASGIPVIVNDTSLPGPETPHRFNPLLPATRAEMALPLQVADRVIGALDIQSSEANAFQDEEISTYQLLADQIAVAIQNARLLVESQQRFEQIDSLNRQLTRIAWEDTGTRDMLANEYTYDLMNVAKQPAEPQADDDDELIVSDKKIRMPITIRGEVIGVIDAAADENINFSESDQAIMRAVADRVAIAIENARLFEETQSSLSETSTLYQLSRYLNEANTLEDIVQAIIVSVMPDATGGQIGVFEDYDDQPEVMQFSADWTLNEAGPRDFRLTGISLNVDEHDILRTMQADQVSLISDTASDPRIDDVFRAVASDRGARALVLIPFSVRGTWRGIVFIEFQQPREFSEREGRIYSALIDQAGVAIDNRMLLQENELALAQIERLYSASRIINMAQTLPELVRAAVTTSDDPKVNFALALLEGEADSTGWAKTLRFVAYSRDNDVVEDNSAYPFGIATDSPLRHREPALVLDRLDVAESPLINIVRQRGAAFMAFFPLYSANQPIALFCISSTESRDLTEEDYEVYRALTGQMSTVLQNRQLFRAAETERERLRSVLETLPAGVLVLDPVTLVPVQANAQASALLGDALDFNQPFSVERYGMYRTNTTDLYPEAEMPIILAARDHINASADDISIFPTEESDKIDLLVNAAPIISANGEVTAIVAAFEDITPLRGLENTLQRNLAETIALYETTRSLAEAEEADDVLDQVLNQLESQNPTDAQVLMLDEQFGGARLARSLSGRIGTHDLPDELLSFSEAHFVDNVATTALIPDEAKQKLTAQGVAAYVSLPLRARARRDVPMGWLVALFDRPQPDLDEREQFLNTLADSASVALDNRQLFRSTQIALQETASLYGATTTISQARDLDQVTSAISSALEALQPDMYAAYLRVDGTTPRELLNVSMDSAPVPFGEWLTRFDLLKDVRTIYIDDIRALEAPSTFEKTVLEHGTVRSLGMLQLRVQGKPAGALFVAYHTTHRFSSGDARYLGSIAESASVVADNILLLSQIQSTLQETSALYQASRRLSNAENTDDILDAAVSYLPNRQISMGIIAQLAEGTWNSEDAVVSIVSSWSSEAEYTLQGMKLTADDFPGWRLLGSPGVLTIDDIDHDETLNEAEKAGLSALGLRSVAFLPLRASGRVIGSLAFGSNHPYTHTERDLRVYTSFAEQASLRLEASRLLAQTERRARQLATSAEVTQIVSSILDLNELMPRLVDTIKESFGYDHVQIFLMDNEDNYAELRASTGEAGRKLLEIKHKLQKGSASVIGTVTKTAQPTIAADTADARVIHRPNPYLPNTRSEMAIPLLLKGQVVGALDVQSNNPNAFDNDDVAVLTTLAGQISTAIDNAQLFEQSQRRANEMGFLFSVTTAAASAETLNDALQNVAQELTDSLDALSVSLYLPTEYLDPDDNIITMLRPVALAGASQPLSELSEIHLNEPQNLLATAARERRPITLNNVAQESRYLPITEGAKSAIIVPLNSGLQLVGVIAVESERLAAYDMGTMTLLLTLSGTLSAIVQNQSLLEQVQKTNEQLRELDRLKSDFLANMSHELRTPLNSIIGFSRVILKGIDGPLTEMQEQDLSTIYNSGVHLLGLINDILDQAKIAAGKMDLQFDYFDMKAVIDGVRSIGIGLVKEKPIDIFVEIAPGLPRSYGDEFRTRQVLLNLVSNAAKFTREGSIVIRAYTQTNVEGQKMVRVDVNDTGIGIAEKDLPLLFEAFRQVDSSLTRTAGGTGLGLPIAKSLVEMQGGEMLVSSEVNVGSTFSILIPVEPLTKPGDERPRTDKLTDEEAEEYEAPGEVHTNGAGADIHGTLEVNAVSNGGAAEPQEHDTNVFATPPLELRQRTAEIKPVRPPMHVKRQILLIEDNPDMVDQFRRSLQREGFDIFAASIPLEAEAMASGLHPTIILMDVNFGNGAGWDILERLRQRDDTTDIPIIVVSLSQERERGESLGVFKWIPRPFMPEDIVEAVREAESASRVERILIIDDQPDSARLLQELLDLGGGFKVFTAQNGMEGIAMVARRRPNLVILDLRMPEMDGFAVIKELRNNPETATIPILVVTGDTALSSTELEQLRTFKVLYKAEISAQQYRPFLDGVKGQLQQTSGAPGD